MELTTLLSLANPMPPHKTYTTHTLEKNTALLYMPQLISQYTSQPHTTLKSRHDLQLNIYSLKLNKEFVLDLQIVSENEGIILNKLYNVTVEL